MTRLRGGKFVRPHLKLVAAGGEPPYDDEMEQRVTKLETHVEHIQSDIAEIKVDLRSMLRGGIWFFVITWTGIIGLALAAAAGYARLSDRIDAVEARVTGKLDTIDAKLDGKLDTIIQRLPIPPPAK